MKHWIIPLLFYWMPLALAAQTGTGTGTGRDSLTPYNPKADYKTWSIKGKFLPYPLGNGGGVSMMVGIEYGFAKNQSIGVDGFAFYQHDDDDDINDTAGVNHQEGVEIFHSWEKAVFLNYRYYFSWQRLRRKYGLAPYLLVFLRYGQLDQYYDPKYKLSSYLSNHEFHSSAGIQIGSTLVRGKRFAIDLNMGVFEKKKVINTIYFNHGAESTTHRNLLGPGFRLSANLEWWFRR